MESKGLAETSLRRGHGSVQVERLYKKQPAIHRKIWFQTTIVGRFKYPFRRRRLHVSTRVSKPIQEDVFSLVIFTTYIHLLHPDLLIRSIDRSRAEQSFGSESFDRRDSRYVAWAECATFARFNNLPLACSYRAQIRFFIAESATNAPQLDADLITMKEGDRGLGAPIETDVSRASRSQLFCDFLATRPQFSKNARRRFLYDFIRGGNQLDNYYFVPGVFTLARCSF